MGNTNQVVQDDSLHILNWKQPAEKPKLIKGGIAVDDRGQLSFVNDFDFKDVKRFYFVENHKNRFVRAWHAHKEEAKYVLAVKGSFLVCAVQIDNWDEPSKNLAVHKFILSEKTPSVLCIPKGFANGFMSLTEDAKIMFLSTSTLDESKDDDYRYDARYWDPWKVNER